MAKMNGSWRWFAGVAVTVLLASGTAGMSLHFRSTERIARCESQIERIDERSIAVDGRLTRIESKLDRLLERE